MQFHRMRRLVSLPGPAASPSSSSRGRLFGHKATVLLLSTGAVSAWVYTSPLQVERTSLSTRISNSYAEQSSGKSSLWTTRLSIAQCDYNNDDNTDNAAPPSSPLPHVDSTIYDYIEPPPRTMMESHAVLGALLENDTTRGGGIRSFHVFKNKQSDSDEVVMSIIELGNNLDGHKGQVHGGILALLMDDTLGYAAIEGLDVPFAVTANLNIDYRAGVPAGSTICIRTRLVERKERKMVWKVTVESYNEESNEAPMLFCEASSVFVIPRHVYAEMNKAAA